MTAALVAAFKSQVASLIDHCKLTPDEIVLVGLSLAASRAKAAALDHGQLHLKLDEAILRSGALIDGAEYSLEAIRAAGEFLPTDKGGRLDG